LAALQQSTELNVTTTVELNVARARLTGYTHELDVAHARLADMVAARELRRQQLQEFESARAIAAVVTDIDETPPPTLRILSSRPPPTSNITMIHAELTSRPTTTNALARVLLACAAHNVLACEALVLLLVCY
jgi:hypothetical protein